MSEFDLDNLLQPVSSADPAGKDPEDNPDFQQLDAAAKGEPERVMGDKKIDAVEPDWKRVISLGNGLLSQSKDIRVAVKVCQALLNTEGFPGLSAGTALVRGLLSEYWDSVHPQLDTEDDNDPTERVNALLNLCDRDAVLSPARRAPLVSSRAFGSISLRDFEIAKGEASEPAGSDRTPPDLSTIDAAFQDCPIDQLRQTADAVSSAASSIKEIEKVVTDRIGVSEAPDFNHLLEILSDAGALLTEKAAARGDANGVSAAASDSEAAEDGAPGTDRPGAPGGHSGSQISSRQDVARMLDKLCDYYARNEPSSPVPLLLQRARRLATKDFMGIVQDLAPDALAQIEAIRGPEDDG